MSLNRIRNPWTVGVWFGQWPSILAMGSLAPAGLARSQHPEQASDKTAPPPAVLARIGRPPPWGWIAPSVAGRAVVEGVRPPSLPSSDEGCRPAIRVGVREKRRAAWELNPRPGRPAYAAPAAKTAPLWGGRPSPGGPVWGRGPDASALSDMPTPSVPLPPLACVLPFLRPLSPRRSPSLGFSDLKLKAPLARCKPTDPPLSPTQQPHRSPPSPWPASPRRPSADSWAAGPGGVWVAEAEPHAGPRSSGSLPIHAGGVLYPGTTAAARTSTRARS